MDIACGTGEFLKRLRDSDASPNSKTKWIGVEPCPEMLQQAQQKFDLKNDDAMIELHQAPAEYLPVQDHSTDVVVTTNAFHFFRDKKRALHEIKRILRKNGTLVITDWCNDYLIVKLYHWMERIRWNWRFEHRYPGPLKRSELYELVNSEGFENIEVSSYAVRVFGVFFWGMQTLKATNPISSSI